MFGRKRRRNSIEHHPDFPRMTDVSYLTVLSEIHARRKVGKYLEIGSRTGSSIAKVNCSYAAVDPDFAITADVFNDAAEMLFFQQTSDAFFESNVLGKLGWAPDLTFVDGMHLFEFALRDFMNAEKAMGKDGIVCLHDVCPFHYDITTRDDSAIERLGAWSGDVWKTVSALLDLRPDLQIDIVAAAHTGLACISNLDPNNTVLADNYNQLIAKYQQLELVEIGADAYFGRFNLVDPTDYIARLG